ncbi:MAG: four helix bundle protein, partial [Saprospiraceae bacterium]|nr:four helix bundle protein [Saprospiraceae bacterium]
MKTLIIQDKALDFSIRIVNLSKILTIEHGEFVISKQLLRSATSIGANLEEALACDSPKEFRHKLSLCYRETRESKYWLKLLVETDHIELERFDHLYSMVDEIAKMLYTMKNKGVSA